MKKSSFSILPATSIVILAFGLVLFASVPPAYCQTNTDSVAFLLQKTPPQGGTTTPSEGVHYCDIGAETILTAVAAPGYQFVYWLGDVSNPTTNRTRVYADVPKIIIAVFERAEFELLAPEDRPQCSMGAGGLIARAAEQGRGGFSSAGAARRPGEPSKPPTPPKPPKEGDFPASEDEDEGDFPVPVPEPSTVLLLGVGGLFLMRGKRTGL